MSAQAHQLLNVFLRISSSFFFAIAVTLWAPLAAGQAVAYEGNVLPDNDPVPWTRYGTFDAQRWVDGGFFYQFLVQGVWSWPYGQVDGYRRTIAKFTGSPSFFVTWREMNTCPRSDMSGNPCQLSASGGPVLFHFTITRDQVEFVRDNPISLVLDVDIEPDKLHTYYLELHNDLRYVWYIDGGTANSGVYPGSFPRNSAVITWSARFYTDEQTAKWDYVRYGVIPADHSGDFNNNGVVDETDLYFFVDCLLGPDYDAAGPGCKWADMNADGKADGADVQLFVSAMTGV